MTQTPQIRVSILGIVGLPARYGGFETLADALVTEAERRDVSHEIAVFCAAPQSGADRPDTFRGAHLRYLPLRANGIQSIPYDILSLFKAARLGRHTVLLLGVSGTIALPLVRAFTKLRVVVHVDGIEWQRPKWRGLARAFLRLSERMAVRWAHEVVSDNQEITTYLQDRYGRAAVEIAYGGDQTLAAEPGDISDLDLPARYALATARIEPENNLEMILQAYADLPRQPLVVIGNWQASSYGRKLRAAYQDHADIYLLDAEFDPARLRALRERAFLYVHGHSAGGTNPALVEMMHFGIPIAAFDCGFNRVTTDGAAGFFSDAATLRDLAPVLSDPRLGHGMGAELKAIARRRYRWSDVTEAYFQLLGL